MIVRAVPISVLLLSGVLSCARPADHCWVCLREIHPQVRAALTLDDGGTVLACCPRCALHYREESGNNVREIRVTDYATGRTLIFGRAFFVEGSDETPCVHHPPVVDETRAPMQVCYDRCIPSLIAFGSAPEARAFIAEHGGTLYPPGAFPGLPRKER